MNNRPLNLALAGKILGVPEEILRECLNKRFTRYPKELTDRELLLTWDIYCEDKIDSLTEKLDKTLKEF